MIDLTAGRVRWHLASAASDLYPPAPSSPAVVPPPRRPDARAYAYRGQPAFASLSMAGSGRKYV
jgi:hypothetical protein